MTKNVDDFIDALNRDLAWRKKEISSLYCLCQSSSDEILLKSLLLILYSHWEGYVKNSSKLYLYHVSCLNLTIGKLSDNYLSIAIKGLANECFKSSKSLTLENEINFIEKYKNKKKSKFAINKDIMKDKNKLIVNSQDNLSSSVFKNICRIIGMPEKDSIKTKYFLIDRYMLNHRNAVGHGNKIEQDYDEDLLFSLDELSTLTDIILEILSQLKDDLTKYAQDQFYLEQNKNHKTHYDSESDLKLKQAITG